jgi:hypothetical protein
VADDTSALDEWRLVATARPVPGYGGYAAREDGRIWSAAVGRLLEEIDGGAGDPYRRVRLTRDADGKRVCKQVHALVALAWLGPKPFAGAMVRHLSGDLEDCRPANLRWGTARENTIDRVAHGTFRSGERVPAAAGRKLSYALGEAIRAWSDRGYSDAAVVKLLAAGGTAVSRSTVKAVRRGERW